MMGLALSLFAVFGGITHHGEHAIALYLAAILFFVGLAHAISAVILRWAMQGMVAAVWWGGGIAILFAAVAGDDAEIFLTAMFFGQIVFGLYAMLLERRRRLCGTGDAAWVRGFRSWIRWCMGRCGWLCFRCC